MAPLESLNSNREAIISDAIQFNGTTTQRATRAEIHLEALRHNVRAIRSLLKSEVKMMAVVKADAYGHGALPCTRAVLEAGADCLGVGIVAEGIELRESGVRAPIQVLTGHFPDEIDDLIQHDLTATIWNPSMAKDLADRAAHFGKQVGVQVKVDTGMGRLGGTSDNLPPLMEFINNSKNLRAEGVFTHFSTADEEDPEFARLQLERFQAALNKIKQAKIPVPPAHCANSSALIMHPESHYSMVRPGLILYGALTAKNLEPALAEQLKNSAEKTLKPVMQWKTRILQINKIPKGLPLSYGKKFITRRDSTIATLPVGYADGLHWTLSGKMNVLIGGQRVNQVGSICMDLCLADVTDLPQVQEGDEVVIVGRQGSETIPVEEVAENAQTIPYEILCCVGKRVPRIYIP